MRLRDLGIVSLFRLIVVSLVRNLVWGRRVGLDVWFKLRDSKGMMESGKNFLFWKIT